MDNSKNTGRRGNPNIYDPGKLEDPFKNRLNKLIDESDNAKETKAGLKEALGVQSDETIRLYTNGQGFPSTQKLLKIARYFNCSLDYLIGLSDVRNPDASLQGACNYTGLSEESIEILRYLQERYDVNSFIEHSAFVDFIKELYNAVELFKSMHIGIKCYRKEISEDGGRWIILEEIKKGYSYIPDALRGTQWRFVQAANNYLEEVTNFSELMKNAEEVSRELAERDWEAFQNGNNDEEDK